MDVDECSAPEYLNATGSYWPASQAAQMGGHFVDPMGDNGNSTNMGIMGGRKRRDASKFMLI